MFITYIICAVVVIGIGFAVYDGCKDRKSKSINKVLTDFAEDLLDMSTEAVSVLKTDIAKFDTADDFRKGIAGMITSNFVDELKKRNVYKESLFTKDNLAFVVDTVFKKYEKELDIDGTFDNAVLESFKNRDSGKKDIDKSVGETKPTDNNVVDTPKVKTEDPNVNKEDIIKDRMEGLGVPVSLDTKVNPLVEDTDNNKPKTVDISEQLNQITSDSPNK